MTIKRTCIRCHHSETISGAMYMGMHRFDPRIFDTKCCPNCKRPYDFEHMVVKINECGKK